MKKDLTIGGIGARSTSVRRRIMKRVCKENVNVNVVKTNIVLSDIADILGEGTGVLKEETTIPNGKTLIINEMEALVIDTSKNLINYGTIINNGFIAILDIPSEEGAPTGGGGRLENNGIIINNNMMVNFNELVNNGSLTNMNEIYVSNGGKFNNTIGTIINTGTINIADGGACGTGTFTSGSYTGTNGNACPFR
jgi:hypothetical protein